MSKRVGPIIHTHTEVRCDGCVWLRSERYVVEDGNDYDSGYDHHCDAADGRHISGFSTITPEWYPTK